MVTITKVKYIARCRSCKDELTTPGDIAVKFCTKPECYPAHDRPMCKKRYHGRTHANCGPQSNVAATILY